MSIVGKLTKRKPSWVCSAYFHRTTNRHWVPSIFSRTTFPSSNFPNVFEHDVSPCTNFQCACVLAIAFAKRLLPAFVRHIFRPFTIFHRMDFLENWIWTARCVDCRLWFQYCSPLSARYNYKACLFFNFVYFFGNLHDSSSHCVCVDSCALFSRYFLRIVDSILLFVPLFHLFILDYFSFLRRRLRWFQYGSNSFVTHHLTRDKNMHKLSSATG